MRVSRAHSSRRRDLRTCNIIATVESPWPDPLDTWVGPKVLCQCCSGIFSRLGSSPNAMRTAPRAIPTAAYQACWYT
jgi:hypothetical protein